MAAMPVDVTDFQQQVLERSRDKPVVVDFWAPWCGPCRILGPVLEKLADESPDWELAKLNTDDNPVVASQYGIQGIPAVKLFVNGEVADEFVGALPEPAVRQWLERALPSETKSRLEVATAALNAGETALAEELLAQVLAAEPANPTALVLTARAVALRDPESAARLVAGVDAASVGLHQVKEAVETVAHLARLVSGAESVAEAPGRDVYLEACRALVSGDLDAALRGFVATVRTNRSLDEDGPRRACIAVFSLLGEQHETTLAHRRAFEMALF
jgi:putative thioredoxin